MSFKENALTVQHTVISAALLDLPAGGVVIVRVLALFGVIGSLLIARFTTAPEAGRPLHNETGLES